MILNQKQLLACATVLVLGALLAACGGAAAVPSPEPAAEPPAPQEPPAQEVPQAAPEAGGEPAAPPPDVVVEAAVEPPQETLPTTDCVETNPHPIGQTVAETFAVPYEQVMTWFCNGDTFDDILLALQTNKDTGVPVEELLRRNREVGWEQVWAEIGYVQPEGE